MPKRAKPPSLPNLGDAARDRQARQLFVSPEILKQLPQFIWSFPLEFPRPKDLSEVGQQLQGWMPNTVKEIRALGADVQHVVRVLAGTRFNIRAESFLRSRSPKQLRFAFEGASFLDGFASDGEHVHGNLRRRIQALSAEAQQHPDRAASLKAQIEEVRAKLKLQKDFDRHIRKGLLGGQLTGRPRRAHLKRCAELLAAHFRSTTGKPRYQVISSAMLAAGLFDGLPDVCQPWRSRCQKSKQAKGMCLAEHCQRTERYVSVLVSR